MRIGGRGEEEVVNDEGREGGKQRGKRRRMLGLGRWMHVNIDNTDLVKGMHHNDLCIACMTIIVVGHHHRPTPPGMSGMLLLIITTRQ
jgi:hypothetical protein